MLKKTVEQRTREVLEAATKQTEAEQAQKLQGEAIQGSPQQIKRENSQSPSTPRETQNPSSSTEYTPTQPQSHISPYSSPQEASYASLARSIAVAAAAAAVANGPSAGPPTAGIPMLGHNPFFNSSMMSRSVSTFSECSSVGSLSIAPSYPGTPFEYPRHTGPLGETPLPSNDPSIISVAQQFPDFAAAVDAHMLKRPATLLHPRQTQFGSTDAQSKRGGRPTLSRINSCPADFVDAFGSVALSTPIVEEPPVTVAERPSVTLASVAEQQTKRRRSRLSPLGVGMSRSKSSMGVCQTAMNTYFPVDVQHLSIPQPSPTLAQVAKTTPSSPTEGRSHMSGLAIKRVTPEKNSHTFLSADVPPTPVSPSGVASANQDMFNESPTLSLARAAGLTQLKKPQLALNTEDIFSPPTTPANSLSMQRAFSYASTEDLSSDAFFHDNQLSSSPSQYFIPGMSEYVNSMDDVFSMSYDSSQDMSTEVDFSKYLEM
jgi:hypothetical protein